jgi:hypothetical protein
MPPHETMESRLCYHLQSLQSQGLRDFGLALSP